MNYKIKQIYIAHLTDLYDEYQGSIKTVEDNYLALLQNKANELSFYVYLREQFR